MTNYELINEAKKHNLYKDMILNGMLSMTVNFHLEIYEYYKTKLKVYQELNNTITTSEEDTSMRFDCSRATIRRAIKHMEYDRNCNTNQG